MIRTSKEKWSNPNKGLQAALAYDAKRQEELSGEFHEPIKGIYSDFAPRVMSARVYDDEGIEEGNTSAERQQYLQTKVAKEEGKTANKVNKWNKERGAMSVEEFVEESNRLANIDLT